VFYIINNKVKFRNTDGLFWLDQDEASGITLTATMSRLLAFLLEHRGEVVSRDEILSHVWDAHGLRSSNNSLNKYISDLRQVFRNMGCSEEIIVTVPRIGFMLSGDCEVEKHASTHQPQDSPSPLVESKPRTKRRFFFINLGVILFILALVSGLKWSFSVNKSDGELISKKTWLLGKINSCQVFAFKPASPETAQQKLAIIKDVLDAEKLSCTSDDDIYIQVADPIYYGFPGRIFLSICKRNDRSGTLLASCYNFYETAYETKKE